LEGSLTLGRIGSSCRTGCPKRSSVVIEHQVAVRLKDEMLAIKISHIVSRIEDEISRGSCDSEGVTAKRGSIS